MAENDSLDVLSDLSFLLAQDDSLNDELTILCEILEDSEDSDNASNKDVALPTEAATTSLKAQKKPNKHEKIGTGRTKYEVRQREEMFLLRQQVDQLKRQLYARLATAKRPMEMSMWERAAKIERLEKNRSLHENEQLKEAVNQQATFIEQMEKFCRKKPRLATAAIHSEAWQDYRLAAQESLRVAAIHAIADRQYRRMQNAFIQAGIFGRTSNFHRGRVIPKEEGKSCIFELINLVALHAPFRVVSDSMWKVFNGERSPRWPEGAVENVDVIDENTVYSRLVHSTPDGTTSHANNIRKRYVEPNRELFVSRTVLEDALVPHMSKGAIENKWSWLEVVPLQSNPNSHCFMTFMTQVIVDVAPGAVVTTAEELATLEAMMQHASLLKSTQMADAGWFNMEVTHIDNMDIPYPKLRSLVERGSLFMKTLEATVNETIRSHRQMRA
ncbi:hypothetical protein LEN26_016436 [Aphanomyces euteiches]|nr:hypothetical protein LEN26_016436 [Aphanomyces euteiches]KAH9105219.1 hypothetical protein AeMF1_018895 [Aphanomyces euteiches]KAH9187401.1 hypothetical protein AeNC1_010622 [Aphanomyces euteiches]